MSEILLLTLVVGIVQLISTLGIHLSTCALSTSLFGERLHHLAGIGWLTQYLALEIHVGEYYIVLTTSMILRTNE